MFFNELRNMLKIISWHWKYEGVGAAGLARGNGIANVGWFLIF